MINDLYNADIIRLAASIEQEGTLEAPMGTARKVSKLCGSWAEIDITIDGDTVADFAIRIEACALGQASAGVLTQNLKGASRAEILAARNALYGMLKSGGAPPKGRFSGLSALKEVAGYPARHISTLLAFDVALAAFDKALADKSDKSDKSACAAR